MNKQLLLGTMTVLLAVAGARGSLYTETFDSGSSVGAIPNGNPVGVTFGGTVSDIPSEQTVGLLTVGLNISGGHNGDLYAYLVAPNGTRVQLMNEPGVSSGNTLGASGAGMNITLQDGMAVNGSIQNETSGSVLNGTYNAAGSLANFNGSAADGTWELFFADEVSGGGTSTLNSWSLGITAVPEPVPMALGIFAGLMGLWWCLGMCWQTTAATNKAPSKLDPGQTGRQSF